MRKHFPETVQICLEDNYRSTGAILETSIAIVSEGPLSSTLNCNAFSFPFVRSQTPTEDLTDLA